MRTLKRKNKKIKQVRKLINSLIFLKLVLILLVCPSYSFDKRMIISPNGLILSTDGEKIAFDFIYKTEKEIGSNVGVIFVKNCEVREITEAGINESPAWSKNSRYIMFRSSTEDGVGLSTIDLQSLEKRRLTFLSYKDDGHMKEITYHLPMWSPLVDSAAFLKYKFKHKTIENSNKSHLSTSNNKEVKEVYLFDLYLYDFKTKSEEKIEENINTIFRNTLDVTYNGNYFTYTKRNGNYNDIWLRDVKNHKEKKVLIEGYDVVYLKASPAKEELLFVSRYNGKERLYILKIRDGKEEILFEGSTKNLGSPSWSSDGNTIVFVNNGNIYVFDINKRKISSKIETKMKNITHPILTKNEKIFFISRYSSIWNVEISGENLKRIFPDGKATHGS